jgi:hypothetical protein
VSVGLPESSIGIWVIPHLGLALSLRPASAIGFSVATRWILAGRERGWALDAFLAGGIAVPTLHPQFVLEATPALYARLRSEHWYFGIGPTGTVQGQLTGHLAVRAPVQLEIAAAYLFARVWVGAQTGVGATMVSQLSPSLEYFAAVFVALRL